MTDQLLPTIETLYRARLADFVAERKRLANELKAAGDKQLSGRVAKLGRPSVSAWAVNQLWWHERETFEALLGAAARMKNGDRDAGKQHRELLAELRERAARLLLDAGSAASDGTLRRVTTTLSALAASGGFEPDPPGALVADRDPPGFEALEGMLSGTSATTTANATPAAARDVEAEKRLEQERRRAEDEARERRLAERERLSGALREAQVLRDAQQFALSQLRSELDAAEQNLRKTQALVAEIEASLSSL